MIKSGIYGLINIVTGKVYVGQAFNIKKRWTNHEVELRLERHCNPYLQASWNKYTEDAFIFIVLEYCGQEVLTVREQHWMDKLKACDRQFGYNQAPAAGSLLGFKASEETKAKLVAKKAKYKGVPRTEEVKAKIKASTMGRIVSNATKEKQRLAKLGKFQSIEHRANRSNGLKGNQNAAGRKHTPEEKLKRGAAIKAAWARRKALEIGRAHV